MERKVRGRGYGTRDISYEIWSDAKESWQPVTKEKIAQLLRDGNVVYLNPEKQKHIVDEI